MEGLPLLPGFAFHDPTIRDFKLKQKFAYKNGFRVLRDSDYGVGRRPIDAASSAYDAGDSDPIEYDPSLTYGRVREYGYSQVVPDYALFAQKCLNFKAFFRQGVFNSPDEHYRVRHVNIIYFLEDDTMCVMEPPVQNAGFKQGRLVRRGKIVKDRDGRVYHWKDLNVGIDIGIYGIVYHTVDCDLFTCEFLRSQGVDVGDKEEAPVDPYTQRLAERDNNARSPSGNKSGCGSDDSRRRFLEYDGMVLSFDATWNDDDYRIMYFLTDDTIAIREVHRTNDGKDPSSTMLKRTKVPKNWKNLPSTYPAVYLERSDAEVLEYYTPKDLKIGETIFIYGRRFLLRDCDAFTRKYYSEMLGCAQPAGIVVPNISSCEISRQKPSPPPHIAFGTPEDTLAGCRSFVPKPPKKDVVRQLYNFPKKLRYLATMEAVHPEDDDRDFIIEYSLSDGKITISEIEKRNSGRRGGCFLSPTLIPKPSNDRDNPSYYTPEDLFIGATINVFNHRFVVKGIDLFVYRYAESNPEKFNRDLRDNLRNYAVRQGLLGDDIESRTLKNLAAEENIGKSNNSEISTNDGPMRNGNEEFLESCQKELSGNADERDKNRNMNFEDEKCREIILRNGTDESGRDSRDLTGYGDFNGDKTVVPERKRLVWADQIDKDPAGHPIISCHEETPECKKTAVRRSSLKNRYNKKSPDARFQNEQPMYENVNASGNKLPVAPLEDHIDRSTGENVLRASCPSYPSQK